MINLKSTLQRDNIKWSNNYRLLLIVIILLSLTAPFSQVLKRFRSNKTKKELCSSYSIHDKNYVHFEFLFENSPSHFTQNVTLNIKGDSLKEINWGVVRYYKTAKDSLNNLYAHYIIDEILADKDLISRHQIDLEINEIIKMKQDYSWCSSLSLNRFQEFVLPYRVANEQITNWREYFFNKYQAVADSCQLNNLGPEQLCITINNSLKKHIKYSGACSIYPGDYSYDEILKSGYANCEGMAHMAMWAMRSIGLAVAKEVVPYWGTYNSGHVWNVLITRDEKIPFGGCGDNPGEMPLFYIPPKVFREVHSYQPNRILTKASKKQEIPPLFRHLHRIDVTHEYFNTLDVNIKLIDNKPKGHNCVFLCVYNNGRWMPVEWAKIKKLSSEVTFGNMNGGILYMPGYYETGNVLPANYPFFLYKDGTQRIFKPDYSKLTQLNNAWEYSYWSGNITDVNKEYTLYMWDGYWKSIDKAIPRKTYGKSIPEVILTINKWLEKEDMEYEYTLSFENVPLNGLYKLGENSRPFWVADGEIQLSTSTPDEEYIITELKKANE